MRTRDATWQQLAIRGDFAMETKAVINNVEYTTITAPTISGGLLAGNSISVGNCIASTATFTVKTTDDIPKAATVVIMCRLTDGEENGLQSQWMTMGTFWINKRVKNDDMIELECYDAMLKGNQHYVDDSQSLNWPKPMQTVVTRIAQQMGVVIDPRTVIKGVDNNSRLTVTFTQSTAYKIHAYSSGGDVTIDWGDGSSTEILRNTQPSTQASVANNNTHTYSAGTYTITLVPSSTLAQVFFYKYTYNNSTIADAYLTSAYVGKQAAIKYAGFASCSALVSLTIAAGGNNRIENEAFDRATALTSLIIPSNITSIGSYAFERATALATLWMESTTPPTFSSNAFNGNDVTQVKVPNASLAAYKAASGWSTYSSRITGYSAGDLPIVTSNYVCTKPFTDDTLLDLLKWIGEVHGGNWVITPENKLRLIPLVSPPPESYYVVDQSYNRIQTDDNYNLIWKTGGSGQVTPSASELIAKYGYAPEPLNVPVVVGEITTASKYTISKITMTLPYQDRTDDQEVTAYVHGDDTGYNLIIQENPYATQTICDDLYTQLNGIEYAPYSVTGACFDPCAEYGDWVIVGDKVLSVLYNMEQQYNRNFRASINAPGEDEVEAEYPFMTPTERMQYSITALSNNADVMRTEINQTQSTIEMNVVKNDEIRTKFALDDTSVTINSGVISFSGNTLTMTSNNFTLDANGYLTCNGADISGVVHTRDSQNKYYIDIEDGKLKAGSISNGTKTQIGYINFTEIGTNRLAGMGIGGERIELRSDDIRVSSTDSIYITTERGRSIESYTGNIDIITSTFYVMSNHSWGTGVNAQGYAKNGNGNNLALQFTHGILTRITGDTSGWTIYS